MIMNPMTNHNSSKLKYLNYIDLDNIYRKKVSGSERPTFKVDCDIFLSHN